MATFRFKIHKLIEVIDGDTVDVMLDLGFSIYTPKRIRLNGIDAPECHTTYAREKACGLKVKTIIQQMLKTDKPLYLVSYSLDGESEKFGRVLGDIVTILETGEYCLCSSLLNARLVRSYTGDKKKKWTVAELKLIEAYKQ